MGIIGSQLRSSSGSCMSPAITSGLFETAFNPNTETLSGNLGYENKSRIPIDLLFRADQGNLTSFSEIAIDNGYTLPTTTTAVIPTGSLAQIKRPNCECTTLHKFKMKKYWCSTCMVQLTFADGYTVTLGSKLQMIKISSNGLVNTSLDTLYVGDMIIQCGSALGVDNTKSSNCIKITAITKNIAAADIVYAYHPETTFPIDKFGSSLCVFSLMLENGVYIFATPDGGAY